MRNGLLALAAATITLTGCAGLGGSTAAPSAPTKVAFSAIKGKVIGGQNPIGFASLQVYQAGTSGYGTGSTPLIPAGSYYAGGAKGCVASSSQTCYAGVVSDAGGNFGITGDYSCTTGTQVYIVATGGNPGAGANNASNLMTGIGLCENIPNIPFLSINEVTTVGTVWALSPFMTDTINATPGTNVINIGAPTSNATGLAQAFADINTLTNVAVGVSPGPATPAGATVPTSEIYAIANSLAACVNTTGSGACTNLFTYTTENSVTPTDTIGAAINIARYPAVNANNILALGSGTPPFATNFTTANDLTLAVTYTGNGINAPSALAVDASGNLWIANSAGNSVTELAHNGAPVGNSPFSAGSITAPTAIAIDTVGNVWVANGNSTLTELSSVGANVGSSPFSGGGLAGPTSIAFDGLGNSWLSNYSNNSVSEFSSNGTAVSPVGGYTATGLTNPIGVAVNPH